MKPLLLLLLLLTHVALLMFLCPVHAELKAGFYDKTCPSAERLVRVAVTAAFQEKPSLCPKLIRMHFHDCFVKGCDASILVDSTAENVAEKNDPINRRLDGYQVIDAAKSAVEDQCPGTVSCADILAFAARDCANITGNIFHRVPSGRRDGCVSKAEEIGDNIPFPTFNATQLVDSFARKGLSPGDLAALAGGHSIGRSTCSSFSKRLYNFSEGSRADPTLSPDYAALLRGVCPSDGAAAENVDVAMDVMSSRELDNKYYVQVENRMGLFESDQALVTDGFLREEVRRYAEKPKRWKRKFSRALVKMGRIQVLTGEDGEIRSFCRVVSGLCR